MSSSPVSSSTCVRRLTPWTNSFMGGSWLTGGSTVPVAPLGSWLTLLRSSVRPVAGSSWPGFNGGLEEPRRLPWFDSTVFFIAVQPPSALKAESACMKRSAKVKTPHAATRASLFISACKTRSLPFTLNSTAVASASALAAGTAPALPALSLSATGASALAAGSAPALPAPDFREDCARRRALGIGLQQRDAAAAKEAMVSLPSAAGTAAELGPM